MSKRKSGKVRILGMATILALLALPCCGAHDGSEESASGGKAGSGANKAAGKKVRWHSSLPDAIKIAKEVKKPLMVDFFSNRCGWCKVLDQKTYTNPEVLACAEKFVSVKVDLGRDPRAGAKYQVRGLPTILFMNSDGTVVHSVIGFRSPSPFLAEMKKALEKTAGK
ncbi:MAG: thioredoxin family protein [bacterium]